MDGSIWRLDHDGWSELWHRGPGGGFDRVAVGGRIFSIVHDDLTALRPRAADGCATCRNALPHGFAHCPACGAALADIPGPAEPCQSIPNAGRPEAGLPPLTLSTPFQREPVPLPESGRQYAFAVAGEPVRLFAVDRDGGWLHEFDRRRATWTRLAGLGEFPTDRSFGMAASPAGLVATGAGRLSVIDLTSGPVPRVIAAPLAGGNSCVGAPCVFNGEALALVIGSSGLHLARRRMVRDGEWVFEPVQQAPAMPGQTDPRRDAFSAPITTETRASWAGHAGTVVASLGEDDRMADAVWRGWSEGFAPYLDHRPYVDPDGRVWQLGSMPIAGNRRGMGFERVRLHNQRDQERIGGSVLASGVMACRLLTLRHRAWVEQSAYDRLLPGRDGDFLVPVLALDRRRCVLLKVAGEMGELVQAGPGGLPTPLLAALHFYDGWTLHDLGLPVALRAVSQVSAFVFAGALYAYDAEENECWRWRLQAAD